MVPEAFFDTIKGALPTVGAISGFALSLAKPAPATKLGTVGRAAGYASLGWVGGYVLRRVILKGIDMLSSEKLPENIASLGPSGAMGRAEPSSMPNPTQYPPDPVRKDDLPKPTVLDGEGSQVIDIKPTPKSDDNVKVQGSLDSSAFGA